MSKKIEKPSLTATIAIPEGIDIRVENDTVFVKGSKGEVSRKLLAQNVIITKEGNSIIIKESKPTKREKKIIGTFAAHIKNMIKGVKEGHYYELKVCSSHFPMNVSVNGSEFVVKNFIGEKIPRKFKIKQGVKVEVSGTQVKVNGIEKELVAQTAASIEQLTRRPGFDKRIFQDGIYIINKDGKMIK